MSRFTKKINNILRSAGWQPNRQVYSPEIKLIMDLGYTLNQPMLDFITEFNGLYKENLFDFRLSSGEYTKAICDIRNGLIGQPCMLVGEFYYGDLQVYITPQQEMFCTDEVSNVFKIADFYDEGIEFICTHGLNPGSYLRL